MSLNVFSLIWFRGGFFAACLALGLLGCGSDAPETYHLSGNVTFDGKPVPAGQIRFAPDTSKGNSGPAGYAQIIEGTFDTRAEGGKGHPGGPMIVQIDGQDPAAKAEVSPDDTSGEEIVKALFPTYQTTAELPKEDSTQDFAVPAEAANVKTQSESGGSSGGGVVP